MSWLMHIFLDIVVTRMLTIQMNGSASGVRAARHIVEASSAVTYGLLALHHLE
jgi:hypothetical protein